MGLPDLTSVSLPKGPLSSSSTCVLKPRPIASTPPDQCVMRGQQAEPRLLPAQGKPKIAVFLDSETTRTRNIFKCALPPFYRWRD